MNEQQPKTAIQIIKAMDNYLDQADLDQKALVLNRDIVDIEEGIASRVSINALVQLSAQEIREITQYRSDVVLGLDHENLIGVANGFVVGQNNTDPMWEAMMRIRRLSRQEDLADDEKGLKQEVFEVIAERLQESMDSLERRHLLYSLESLDPKTIIEMRKDYPEVFLSLVVNVEEIGNKDLRDLIKTFNKSANISL